MYGGMGGMGGMYGGGMYGQPGMMGPGHDPNDPNSLTNSFSQSTQATFQIIENLVGAFGGVAQMLESTYMATHSSFFGMFPIYSPLEVERSVGRTLTITDSNGIRSRAILHPPHNTWLNTRNFHIDALLSNAPCQNHRTPTTRRRYVAHTFRLRLIPGTVAVWTDSPS